MKFNYWQKNLFVAALAVLALLIFAAIFPRLPNAGRIPQKDAGTGGESGLLQEKTAPPSQSVGDPNQSAVVVKTSARQGVTAIVTKVLDGDTIIIQGGIHVRLLGIDADEADYPCYQAAKSRLEELVLEKSVLLEMDSEDLDQYGRQLRFIFLNGENINQKMVAEGLAIARFYPQNQKYKTEITAAETQAIKNKTGCKWEK